jgi:nitrogen fixation NifU-like protein
MENSLEQKIAEAVADTEHVGEMPDADAVGTAGSEDCGDMLRMWIKFTEKDGKKVIDKASFQTFGCQTALAVASVASRLIRGRTAEEALNLRGEDLAAPLGALPPMKIHCAQLVENALQEALLGEQPASSASPPAAAEQATTLLHSLQNGAGAAPKIKLQPPAKTSQPTTTPTTHA